MFSLCKQCQTYFSVLKRVTDRFYRSNRLTWVKEQVIEHAESDAVFRSRIGATILERWTILSRRRRMSIWCRHFVVTNTEAYLLYLKTWRLFDEAQRPSVSLSLSVSLSKLPSIFVGINQAMSRCEWMNTSESQYNATQLERQTESRGRNDEAYVQAMCTWSIEQNVKRRWRRHSVVRKTFITTESNHVIPSNMNIFLYRCETNQMICR